MDLIIDEEVFQEDKRNTKKTLLPTDAICVACGVVFNAYYESSCVICGDDVKTDSGVGGMKEKNISKCDHEEFISGRECVDLRILLDYHMEDLRALAEIHGCSESSGRGKIVMYIMKKLYPSLDKRINEDLIRKIIKRNSKKFRFWRDIEGAVRRAKAKKPARITLIDDDVDVEIIKLGEIGRYMKGKKYRKIRKDRKR